MLQKTQSLHRLIGLCNINRRETINTCLAYQYGVMPSIKYTDVNVELPTWFYP